MIAVGDEPPKRYENVETGTEMSVYDLAIGARHAKLEKDPDEGSEEAIRFNGDLYVPVETANEGD